MGALAPSRAFALSAVFLLVGAASAQAQTTVRVDQAPLRVNPGETFEIVWTVNSPDPVDLTTVVWGEQSGRWTRIGALRSGPPGTFRSQITAPVRPGTIYYAIYVRSGTARGVSGERTVQVQSAPIPTPTAPAAPDALTADATAPDAVALRWSDNALNETGFVLQRAEGSGSFATVAQLPADSVAYDDTGLAPQTTYRYRVAATNQVGSSAWSAEAQVTTPAPQPAPQPPAAASNLRFRLTAAGAVELTWQDNSSDETAFLVGRRTGSGGQFAQIAQVAADVTTYTDASVQPSTSYEYSVFATNAVGSAAGSNVVRVQVPAASSTVAATRRENPPLDIPDNDASGAVSRLVVQGAGSIQALQVSVEITHTWRGDLVLQLTSPAGTTITLFDVNDNDGNDDVRGTFPTTLNPTEPLSRFNGEEVNGVWELRVIDTQGQDEGTIDSWSLRADVSPSGGGSSFGLVRRVPVRGLRFPVHGAPPPTSLRADNAFPNLSFQRPVFLTHAGDGTDRLFVVEQAGRILVFRNDPGVASAQTFLDIRGRVTSGGERGLLGLAFDPAYAQNGTFYVYYTGSGGRTVVSRFRVSAGDPNRADPGSEQVVLTVGQPYSNHNGGMIAFGPDDMLYVGLGDGGSGGDPQGNGQNKNTLLGAILRLDVRNQATYRVPQDNPFVGRAGRDEIWAYGLRNPWRFSFDRATGDLWAGDVGQNAVEEVDIITRGGNYGWNIREGDQPYAGGSSAGLTEPVYAYDQSNGRSVIGGYVYRGSRIPGLQGLYVYGDYTAGAIWSLKYRNGRVEFNRQVASVNSLVAFGEDEAGELYAVSHSGRIYRFAPNSGSTTSFPQTLSATGLFQDTANLVPAPGLIEYDVAAPLWSDNARKRRWIALPGNDKIVFSPQGNWQFPVGTVLVKHFELEMRLGDPTTARRLETRVLIHEASGWAGYTYRWNQAGTDAVLLRNGEFETYTIQDASAPGGQRSQQWYFPSRVDCMNCHTQAAGFVLGPRTGQLNSDFDYPTRTDNQLRSWNHIGLFTTNIGDPSQYPAFADYKDASLPLAHRARAYLAANCSGCHRPGGPTPHQIDLRHSVSRADMNVIGATPGGGDLGVPGAQIVMPGDKTRSVLWLRMGRRDFRGMPTIGSALVDPYGHDLIGQWIDAGAQ